MKGYDVFNMCEHSVLKWMPSYKETTSPRLMYLFHILNCIEMYTGACTMHCRSASMKEWEYNWCICDSYSMFNIMSITFTYSVNISCTWSFWVYSPNIIQIRVCFYLKVSDLLFISLDDKCFVHLWPCCQM